MIKIILIAVSLMVFTELVFAAELIDLNTATRQELESVKGIGPKKAQAIITYRNKHGDFKNVDELDNVKGIGKKSVAKYRSFFTVGPPSKGLVTKAGHPSPEGVESESPLAEIQWEDDGAEEAGSKLIRRVESP